jgi:DNA anti-recombination protein RmuC
MALFDDYYDKTPEDERNDKRPKIKRKIIKSFRKFVENLDDQLDKVNDELDEARKELSSGNIEKLKEIDLIYLKIEEIEKRKINMIKEEVYFIGGQ